MKKLALILMLMSILGGCAPKVVEEIVPGGGTAAGNFEEDLMNRMPDDKNVIISPYSIRMALALAANGASGETKSEMLDVLGVDDLAAYNEASKNAISSAEQTTGLELNISNSIWLNKDNAANHDVKFSDKYKNTVGEYFGAAEEVTNADAVDTINGWIEDKTEGKIKNMLNNPNFLAALVNAIYFKADWVKPFEADSTREKTFTDAAGKEKQIDFMNQTEDFWYYEGNNFQMLEMKYRGQDISMYVFLPEAGEKVAYDDMKKAIEEKTSEEVEVSIPKFKTEFDVSLKDVLSEMGIERAFDSNRAEFKDMFANQPEDRIVYVDKVLHKAFIEVDEKGTEAAAATVVLMTDTVSIDIPQRKPKVFNANHPFSYIIRDNVSGDIYFSGQFSYAE